MKIVKAIDGTFVVVPREPFIDVEELQERMGYVQIIDEIDKRSDEIIGIPTDDEHPVPRHKRIRGDYSLEEFEALTFKPYDGQNYGEYLLNRPDIIFEGKDIKFGCSSKRLSRR